MKTEASIVEYKTFFSVVIPTYNRAHAISRAINSILNQTFQDFEIIVIDDASKDTTEEVVRSLQDDRIVYLKNESNLERCLSRNKGIDLARGRYICFLDSDDYHLPDHLESIYKEIESNNFPKAFFFTNAWNETESGERSERCCPDFESVNPYSYFLQYTVNPQRWAVHKSIFETVSFDKEVVICEDMDTSLRIVQAGFPIFQVKKRTTVYVAAHDSFTHGDPQKWEKELFYLKRIFSKVQLRNILPTHDCNRLLSMCYFHLAQKAFESKQSWNTWKYAFLSYFKFPKGYNGKTNKILLVSCLYSLPIVGNLVQKLKAH